MTTWRPHKFIRVKALGLHFRDGKLLASPVRDDAGKLKGVRPLGGGVEFGETWQQALKREFQEELGTDISITGEPIVMENIYQHEGETGHEILFIAEIEFPSGAFTDRERVKYFEDNGNTHVAEWYCIENLDASNTDIFPLGLLEKLRK